MRREYPGKYFNNTKVEKMWDNDGIILKTEADVCVSNIQMNFQLDTKLINKQIWELHNTSDNVLATRMLLL